MKKKKTLEQQVYEKILHQIMLGEFTPGTHLTEKMLSDSLRTSRTPVRRALSRLEAEGVLKHEDHCGVVVQHFRVSVHDYIAMLEIRVQFFSMSIQKSQRKHIAFDIQSLYQTIENIRSSIVKEDITLYYQELSRFHRLILLPAKNELALRIMDEMEQKFRIGGSHQFIYEVWKPIRHQVVDRVEEVVQHLEKKQYDQALHTFEETVKEIIQFMIL
ncbi:GntR family transcriptional regulator [Bacillus wiedmannii]|uniref:GntR family transcriptional regulator n=1 Tax=Bacillus wiedmannii TaxID=1890302 RepID=UPI000BEFD5E7|nr:GntR family transcriptional regulator [Bacillus wiedmannii]PEO40994.1 GntR family transcriptional regulator [Bacillus wiedmannii]